MYGNRRRREGLGILLLAYQLMSFGFDRIPPVTLVAILGQAAIFLGFVPALASHNISSRVWRKKEWIRLIAPSFMHADDMHLYFNMVSLLWKGHRLERRLGSGYFAYLILVFSVLCNVAMVLLSVVVDEHLGLNFGLMQQCGIGFSGVLFALKVLCNHYFPDEDRWVFGWLPVPSRWACWAELLLIQLIVPDASFVGHLAGILVGLAYVHGPLRAIMDTLFNTVTGIRQQRQYFHGHGTWGGQGGPTSQGRDYYTYTGGMTEEEQIRRATDQSLRDTGGPGFARHPTAPPYPSGRMYPDLYT